MSPGMDSTNKIQYVSRVKSEGREAMTYISDQQLEQNSLDSILSANILSLKEETRPTVHDQHII
jgi:hypothetical protein